MKQFYQTGLRFACTQCHACCRGEPGYVMLSHADIKKLAEHLAVSARDFLQQYCRRVERFQGEYISLIEKDNYDCIFWSNGCQVYPARPFQCSSYPFWGTIVGSESAWERESRSCPGINTGSVHDADAIRKKLEQRARESYALWSDYFPEEVHQ